MKPVFVLSLFDTGVLTAKCLYKYRIPVYGFDYNEKHSGFKSRLLTPYKCPNPKDSSTDLLDFIVKKAESLRIKPVLIPASDEYVYFVNENREELEKYFTFILPSYDIAGKFLNKGLQLLLASDYGFNVPGFYNINSAAELSVTKDRINYPCVLKPFRSEDKYLFDGKVTIIKDKENFLRKGSDLLNDCKGFIAQEIIEGSSENNFEVNVLYLNKDVIFSHVINKIRQFPDDYGTGCLITSCQNEYLENLARKFAIDNNVYGFSNTEFKYSNKEQKYFFIETNIRVWQQIDMTIYMQNYVLAYYNYCTGNKISHTRYNKNRRIKWVEVVNDFQTANKHYSKGEISLLGWLKSYKGKKTFGTLSKYEVRPFLKEVKYGKKIINYIFRNKNV